MKIKVGASSVKLVFQQVDRLNLEELILRGPMGLHSCADFAGVDVFKGWAAIPYNSRIDLGRLSQCQHGQRSTHTESSHSDLESTVLQVLHCATDVLRCGV